MTRSYAALAPPLVLALAVAMLPMASAQEVVFTLSSPIPTFQGRLGSSVAAVPDGDGDGADDLLAGAYRENGGAENAGRAHFYSGATGALLHTLESPNPQEDGCFGCDVAGVEDADGDGRGDLLVGGSWEDTDENSSSYDNQGRAYLFSGATGRLLRTLTSPNPEVGARFGTSVAGVPDLDGDGRGDLLVGAEGDSPGVSPNNAGRAYVFSGRTGALLRTLASPNEERLGLFGSVAGAPDLDGDGRGDLLVGARGESARGVTNAGRAYCFSGATGALLHTLEPPDPQANAYFGAPVAGVADVDGDGRGDLLAGAPEEDVTWGETIYEGSGRAYLYSGADGALLHTLESPSPWSRGKFGRALAGVEDVGGDGVADLLVGAYEANRAYVFSGASGAPFSEITSPNEEPRGLFGSAVAGVRDASEDGRGGLLIGAPDEGSTRGRVHLFAFTGDETPLAVFPEALDFGLILVGTASPTEAVAITAVGAPLTVTALALDGADPAVFEVVAAPPLPFTLQPGESAEVEVAFAPTRTGPAAATLTVVSDAGSASVALAGGGRIGGLLVTTLADTDDGTCDAHCSLREAFAVSNAVAGRDTVRFAQALFGGTITFADGATQLVITDDLFVNGNAGGLGITVDAQRQDRVLEVPDGSTDDLVEVELAGLTITGGLTGGNGGGVLSGRRTTLVLRRCTITGNEAGGDGGGVYSESSVNNAPSGFVVERSTVSDNAAGGDGGGLYVDGEVQMRGSTISGNRARRGGGLYGPRREVDLEGVTVTRNEAGEAGGGLVVSSNFFEGGGPLYLRRAVVAGNTVGGHPAAAEADCTVYEAGYGASSDNVTGSGTGCGDLLIVVEVAPEEVFTRVLDPALADNGGPTPTHGLLWRANNPALDIGGTCGPTDQRLRPAPLDGPDADATPACDAGAVEAAPPPVAVTLVPAAPPVVLPPEGGSFTFTATLTNTSGAPQAVTARTAAVLPDGRPFGPLLGPVTVTLGAGQSLTRALVQRVPAGAPGGAYGYVGYATDGVSGGVAVGGFAVEKEGVARGVALAAALDRSSWPLAYADGAPVAAGEVWAVEEPAASASAEATGLPTAFALAAPRPNPTAGRVALAFDLPRPAHVRLAVYDVLGREVALVVDGERAAGRHEAALDGSGLPAGTYLVRIAAGLFVEARPVTLLR